MIVAVCQPELSDSSHVEHRMTHNSHACSEGIMAARSAGAQLVVLPELAQSGYFFNSKAQAHELSEPASGSGRVLKEWCDLSRRLGVIIVGGFNEDGLDGELYNSCVLIEDGFIRAVHRKAHLFEPEDVIFRPGDEPPVVVETAVGRIGMLICYDNEMPEYFALPCLAGADIIAAPVAWEANGPVRPEGERCMEVVRLQAAACVNHVFVAAADRSGNNPEVTWTGGSVIIDCDGYPVAGPARSNQADLLCADIDLHTARDKNISGSNHVHNDRRPDLYQRACTRVASRAQ